MTREVLAKRTKSTSISSISTTSTSICLEENRPEDWDFPAATLAYIKPDTLPATFANMRESETTSTRAEARMACRSSDEAVAAGEDLVGPKGANVKLAWGSGAVQAWLGSGSPGGGATF